MRHTEHELRELDSRSVAAQLRDASDSTIADALQQLSPEQAHKVLERFDPARRVAIERADVGHDLLLGYDYAEGTVGRLMESAPAIFPPGMTIAEAIESLREVIEQRMVIYVFVADAEGFLHGVVAFRELVFGARNQTLAEVMVRDPFFLKPTMSLVDAMHEVVTRHYPIYPVCEPDGHLLGLVKGASLFEQQAFAISAQAGAIVGVEKEERLATSWQRSFLYRHPWLLVNLLTVAISASVVSVFQSSINKIVVLAIFLPVMSGQCGNLGNQSLAVVFRGDAGRTAQGRRVADGTQGRLARCVERLRVGRARGRGDVLDRVRSARTRAEPGRLYRDRDDRELRARRHGGRGDSAGAAPLRRRSGDGGRNLPEHGHRCAQHGPVPRPGDRADRLSAALLRCSARCVTFVAYAPRTIRTGWGSPPMKDAGRGSRPAATPVAAGLFYCSGEPCPLSQA